MKRTILFGLSMFLAFCLTFLDSSVNAQSANWLSNPPAASGSATVTSTCPSTGQWLLLYWGGLPADITVAAQACPGANRIWASKAGKWMGFSREAPQASDSWSVFTGEAEFLGGGSPSQVQAPLAATLAPTVLRTPTVTATTAITAPASQGNVSISVKVSGPDGVTLDSVVVRKQSSSDTLFGFIKNGSTQAIGTVSIDAGYYDAEGLVVASRGTYSCVRDIAPGDSWPFSLGGVDPQRVKRVELQMSSRPAEKTPSKDLEISAVTSGIERSGSFKIAGEVANRSSGKYGLVHVCIAYFNSSGEIVGETEAFTRPSTIEPGQKATFEETWYSGDVASYRLLAAGF